MTIVHTRLAMLKGILRFVCEDCSEFDENFVDLLEIWSKR